MDQRLPLELLLEIIHILDPEKGTSGGAKALSQLLQTSRFMYRLVLPIYYSHMGTWKVAQSRILDSKLSEHSDKNIFSYIQEITICTEKKRSPGIPKMISVLLRMGNLKKLHLRGLLEESLDHRLQLQKVLKRLVELEIVNMGVCLYGSEWIEPLNGLQTLSLPGLRPGYPVFIPKNLKTFTYYGDSMESASTSPCLNNGALTTLNIPLSTLACYLGNESSRCSFCDFSEDVNEENTVNTNNSAYPFLPKTLRHLHLNCSNSMGEFNERDVLFFLPILRQLSITRLELEINIYLEQHEDFELARWIDAFPTSLTHWQLIYNDAVPMSAEEAEGKKISSKDHIQRMIEPRKQDLKSLKKITLEWKFLDRDGFWFDWDFVKNKFLLTGLSDRITS